MTTFAGAPVTLEGTRLKPGSIMPDFTVTDVNLAQIDPMKIEGTKIILSVPSADTPVCSADVLQTSPRCLLHSSECNSFYTHLNVIVNGKCHCTG